MTHREAICKKCRKTWNISIGRDTSNGYVCPICSFKIQEVHAHKAPAPVEAVLK